MEQNGKTFTAVNLKNINIQVDGVTVYLNGDTLHVIDNYNPGKIKDLQEEITILREQLRGTREELSEARKLNNKDTEASKIMKEQKKPTPEERFRDLLKGCTFKFDEKYPESTFLFKGDKLFFELRKDILWCSWSNVWDVFEREDNMSYVEIQNLIKIQMEERFIRKGITPDTQKYIGSQYIEEHFKCKGITPECNGSKYY